MNQNDLFLAFDDLGEDILERSETAGRERKRTNQWLKWGTMAACLCLVILGAVAWRQFAPIRNAAPAIAANENRAAASQLTKPGSEEASASSANDGVSVPRAEFSLANPRNEAVDMIGFFLYQGRCYVQYEWLFDDVDIVGEYLGTATGLIDEWTPQDGYVELAGSVQGDFYEAKGYDPAFLLCMKASYGDVSTYICNNGITLKYGSELYEDRLHLSGNLESVEYESRTSWYYDRGERYRMNGIRDEVLDFIEAMDSAQFVLSDSVPLDEGKSSIVDTELYHMYFQMKDGTTIHLRLHEDGYVRFDGMWDLCVQVPQESYSALLGLLENHTDATES